MSYFDDWLEDYFSPEDIGRIHSIKIWSYGTARKLGAHKVRLLLHNKGMAKGRIAEFIDGAFEKPPPEYHI